MEPILLSPEEAKAMTVEEILEKFSTREQGLTSEEAGERLQVYGFNEIAEKKVHPILKFLSYFWGPIPGMIEVAALLSAFIQHWEDFFIIFTLLLLNAVVGFWQEHKAGNAIDLLKRRLALQARVKRDGLWQELPARELAPGDWVRVRLGDIVPADLKLVAGDYLLADESALTGESLPVDKHPGDVAFAGANISQGEMDALVVATGMHTFFGKTAKLVEEAKTQSHFQKAILKIGNYLIIIALLLVAIIFLAALFRHESLVATLQFALVLTVAAIPVALPAVLSVTLAVGAVALAQKEAIVSKLVAIEEMAGMDVLCSDKTGTITQNRLTVAEVEPLAGYSPEDVLLAGILASREEDQDPIDNAIIAKGKSLSGLMEKALDYRATSFRPFDPVIKRTEASLEDAQGGAFKVSKGAPQVILELIEEKAKISAQIEATVNAFAAKGYRALGVARADETGPWQFLGLIPLYDPPRQDSTATIQTAQAMGVRVKMVTGDHAAIAKEIARLVHLGDNILPVSTFLDKPDREAQRVVDDADGFAQVYPEHKFHIVELLQAGGHIVGMTGDGVNDAPALKKADAGIAVAGATDAAKSAAHIVLTRPGLSVIIDAIKESRKIFQRMQSYAIYRIAETIRVLFFIALAILVFNFYPVTAIMIVLLALFNDAPIMAIAYDNVRYSMAPERWNMRVILGMATLLGFIGVLSSFFIYYIGQHQLRLSGEALQSFIFLKLAVAGHLTIFLARSRGPFWSIRPSAMLFWSAVITKILATLVAVFGWYIAPIGWKLALVVWGYALVAFLITDLIKVYGYKLLDHSGLIFSRP
jgi:H+-transporting ATPase